MIVKGFVMKEGEKRWVLRRFQKLRSYRDVVEMRNSAELPFSLRIGVVQLHIHIAHLYRHRNH